MKEVLERCYFCHAPLKLEISKTVIHTYEGDKTKYVVKNEPRLDCTKCNSGFGAEPYQYEKTDMFMKFLKSIRLKKAEIEYKDMIRYVDEVLGFNDDD